MCITNAIGFSGIFNGFAGKDGTKTQPKDLLPFSPDDEDRNRPVMSPETTRVVLEAIDKRQIAQPVIAALILANPEIQQLMQR